MLVSPADETPSEPCDARPDEVDVALGIERVNEATTLGLRSVRQRLGRSADLRPRPGARGRRGSRVPRPVLAGRPGRLRDPDGTGDGPMLGRSRDRPRPARRRHLEGRHRSRSLRSQTWAMQPMTLTPEQHQFRAVVRQFAEDKLAPLAAETDERAEYSWAAFDALRSMELDCRCRSPRRTAAAAPTSSPRPSWPRSCRGWTRRPASSSSSPSWPCCPCSTSAPTPSRSGTCRGWRAARARPATASPRPTPAPTSRRWPCGRCRTATTTSSAAPRSWITNGGISDLYTGVRQDRPARWAPGHQRVRGREGLGRAGRPSSSTSWASRARPPRSSLLDEVRVPGREPHRRGGPGLLLRHAHARPQPPHHRRAGRRHRPGGAGLRRRLHEGAPDLRPTPRRRTRACSGWWPTRR